MANPSPGSKSDPGHKISVAPSSAAVTVTFGGVVIASTRQALELSEANYPSVIYIPFEDIAFAHLERTSSSTHCPFKGDASYWRVKADGSGRDVMWAYLAPYDEMAAIKDHGAFYPDRVTIDAG